MVCCCEKTPSSRPEPHAVRTAGAKSGTSHTQRWCLHQQALLQLVLALRQHGSMHWNFKPQKFPGIPELLLQDECLHTLAVSGDMCNVQFQPRHLHLENRSSLLSRTIPGMLLHVAGHGAAWQLFGVPSRSHRVPALHLALIMGAQTSGAGLPSGTCVISCNAIQGRHKSSLSPQGYFCPAVIPICSVPANMHIPRKGPTFISIVDASLADCKGKPSCVLHLQDLQHSMSMLSWLCGTPSSQVGAQQLNCLCSTRRTGRPATWCRPDHE